MRDIVRAISMDTCVRFTPRARASLCDLLTLIVTELCLDWMDIGVGKRGKLLILQVLGYA